MNKRILSREQLKDRDNKYSYCPICVKELTNDGKDYKSILNPLYLVTDAEPVPNGDGTFSDIIDSHYECPRCKTTNITVNMFVRYYAKRADNTAYTEPPKDPVLMDNYKLYGDFLTKRIYTGV